MESFTKDKERERKKNWHILQPKMTSEGKNKVNTNCLKHSTQILHVGISKHLKYKLSTLCPLHICTHKLAYAHICTCMHVHTHTHQHDRSHIRACMRSQKAIPCSWTGNQHHQDTHTIQSSYRLDAIYIKIQMIIFTVPRK